MAPAHQAAGPDDDPRDVALYRAAGARGEDAPAESLINLFNLLASAACHAVVVNSARAGLGTALPVGRSLRTDGLYYQALRVYSCFDWELERALLHEPAVWPLPAEVALVAGRFGETFARQRAEERAEQLIRARRAARILVPRVRPFELRRLEAADCAASADGRRLLLTGPIRDALWQGTAGKLASIARDACSADATDVPAKLEAMIGAFAPLSTLWFAAFDRGWPADSFTRLIVYLPAYHTLHAEEVDHPESWRLEKGLRRTALPAPVVIQGAEITHLSYLQHADPRRPHAIKIEIARDFDRRDRVTSVVSFGQLFGAGDDPLGLDTTDHRDALHLHYRAKLPQQRDDPLAARTVKDALNRRLGALFEVDARIHRLTLHLCRPLRKTLAEEAAADDLLRPRFCLEESRISFRAHRQTDSAIELAALRAAGFECDPVPARPGRYLCHRDFRTWGQLRDELPGSLAGGDAAADDRAVARDRPGWNDELLSRLIGIATREVLAQSIPRIEDAIDDEIAHLASGYLERYRRARRVLADRLHRAIR